MCQVQEDPNQENAAFENPLQVDPVESAQERERNVLSEFYPDSSPSDEKLECYTHRDACDFVALSDHFRDVNCENYPMLPRNTDPIENSDFGSGVRAYYRVVGATQASYSLCALHANVHGDHRGDLCYIEVNDRTVAIGNEGFSVIGKLLLGDIIVVYQLAVIKEFKTISALEASPDTPIWMASKIAVYPRDTTKVHFSVLANKTAVVLERNHEVMNVSRDGTEVGKIYSGTVFVPKRMKENFTEEYDKEKKTELMSKCSTYYQPFISLATIFEFTEDEGKTRLLQTGKEAFSTEKSDKNKEEIVELCGLFGYAAMISQQEWAFRSLRSGFFKNLAKDSNARRIIEALYGGSKISPVESKETEGEYKLGAIVLDEHQSNYVDMLLNRKNPIVIGSSPFGSGKSVTIIAAAREIQKRDNKIQLLVTQSNFASVNLVEIAKRIPDFKIVRFITEKNRNELSKEQLTDSDLPILMIKVFREWASGQIECEGLTYSNKKTIVEFLLDSGSISEEEARRISENNSDDIDEALSEDIDLFDVLGNDGDDDGADVFEVFFMLYKPHVIMVTADSVNALRRANIKKFISTVQIDEASQLPECTLLHLLSTFPNANFGLIGDTRQLPPYSNFNLQGPLKDFGIGNTMEQATEKGLFPEAKLCKAYRCHPKITNLLSELFYNGILVSGVLETERNEFMTRRSDFWPNPNFPIMIVNNIGSGNAVGTSYLNYTEKKIVMKLLEILTEVHNGYQLEFSDIGIISFYKAQTYELAKAIDNPSVKVGTVDSFQGVERKVMIVCCTNKFFTKFMQDANRLNVALSRAKEGVIVVGNVYGMEKAEHWKTIVSKVKSNRCVIPGEKTLPSTCTKQ